jgi:hypothetical protein
MPKVLILVDSDPAQSLGVSVAARSIITALQTAIREETSTSSTHPLENPSWQIEVQSAATLTLEQFDKPDSNFIFCPLTLAVPDWLSFPARSVFQACQNIEGLRQRVSQWHYKVGEGNGWLPIVLTGKGPLYAEVIGVKGALSSTDLSQDAHPYFQPVHLVDVQRQPLYQLAQRLLRSLMAPPSVYLLQFGFHGETLQFDRLIPFPAAPAIASIHRQEPNLFACHWRCLTAYPLRDLLISANHTNPERSF